MQQESGWLRNFVVVDVVYVVAVDNTCISRRNMSQIIVTVGIVVVLSVVKTVVIQVNTVGTVVVGVVNVVDSAQWWVLIT